MGVEIDDGRGDDADEEGCPDPVRCFSKAVTDEEERRARRDEGAFEEREDEGEETRGLLNDSCVRRAY